MQRGTPPSLVMFRTSPKTTKVRSPGPGPITKKDWEPQALKRLKGRCVFLHTDGARSYKMGANRKRAIDGIVHDFVVHKKKKINGQWVRPKYLQLFRHRMPNGEAICTKGGTQIIDRVRRHVREIMGSRSPAVNQRSWDNRVRSAQWLFWNMGQDLWSKTGHMLAELSSEP